MEIRQDKQRRGQHMIIEYYKRDHWGVERKYILNPRIANAVRVLTGKRTVDNQDIQAMLDLNIEVVLVPDPEKQ